MEETDWTPVTPREKRVSNKPGCWHNPTGALIREVGPEIWVIERCYVDFTGMDVGGKTTIVRLRDRRLFVHSALTLNAELKQAVDALGTVSIIVAPNTQHIDFVKHWKKHYPNAIALSPPGFSAKKKDVPFDGEIDPVRGHPAWGADIEHCFVAGAPFMNETVFYHPLSKTLIVTDVLFPSPEEGVGWLTRIGHWILQTLFGLLYHWVLIKDRRAWAESFDRIESWEFDRLIPTHGVIVEESPKDELKRWNGRD